MLGRLAQAAVASKGAARAAADAARHRAAAREREAAAEQLQHVLAQMEVRAWPFRRLHTILYSCVQARGARLTPGACPDAKGGQPCALMRDLRGQVAVIEQHLSIYGDVLLLC